MVFIDLAMDVGIWQKSAHDPEERVCDRARSEELAVGRQAIVIRVDIRNIDLDDDLGAETFPHCVLREKYDDVVLSPYPERIE